MSKPRKQGIVRRNPVTTASAGGFTVVGTMSDQPLVKWLSYACAIGAVVLRYLDTNGGISGVWDRIWKGRR